MQGTGTWPSGTVASGVHVLALCGRQGTQGHSVPRHTTEQQLSVFQELSQISEHFNVCIMQYTSSFKPPRSFSASGHSISASLPCALRLWLCYNSNQQSLAPLCFVFRSGGYWFNTDACIQGPVLCFKAIFSAAPSAHVAWEIDTASPSWKLSDSQRKMSIHRTPLHPNSCQWLKWPVGAVCSQVPLDRWPGKIANNQTLPKTLPDICKYRKIKDISFFFKLKIIFLHAECKYFLSPFFILKHRLC